MPKVALIIIYNHQYDKNIELLEGIYKDRFADIYHIVPFYTGRRTNVIPVYESSHYFQGYVAQAAKSFTNAKYDHYFFIADDLVINPMINEENYHEHLKLGPSTCFIPDFLTLHDIDWFWRRTADAYNWSIKYNGVEAEGQLPSVEIALNKFNQFGLTIKPLRFDQIWRTPSTPAGLLTRMRGDKSYPFRYAQSKLQQTEYALSYPMVGSYSDIFAISADALKKFCHCCGVFAATRLFVEVAIPTAMVLSAEAIITERDLDLKGKALWSKAELSELNRYDHSLKSLMSNFPKDQLYVHPVKLSKWKVEL